MRLTVAGCSGSMSGPASAASGYLIQAEDGAGRTWSVLVDLGPGALGQVMNHVDPRDVDALLISHLHPDHMADVCSLQVFLRYHPEGETGPLPTWGPEGTAERIAEVCWMADRAEVDRQFTVREHRAGEVVTVGPLRIEAVPMRHPVPAFGFRVAGPGRGGTRVVLAYTGDTDTCAGLARLADGVDLLLAEASFQEGREDVRGIHLTGRRAGEVARGGDGTRAAARLVLTHLPPWTDPAVVQAEAAAAYAGPIEVAAPGAVWEL